MSVVVQLGSEQACGVFAARVAQRLHGGLVLGLTGDLGAGKTTFVRYLLAALGSADVVSSPTFVLEHEYRAGTLTVRHWDLYRLLNEPLELTEPPASDELRLIEWIDRAPQLMAGCDLILAFALTGETTRSVAVSGPGVGSIFPDGIPAQI